MHASLRKFLVLKHSVFTVGVFTADMLRVGSLRTSMIRTSELKDRVTMFGVSGMSSVISTDRERRLTLSGALSPIPTQLRLRAVEWTSRVWPS